MIDPAPTLAFIGPLGWPEMIILALLGVLIFGKRLPEVGKSVGKGIVEFKKGLSGVQEELENQSSRSHEELEETESEGATFEGSDQQAEPATNRSSSASSTSAG